MLWRVGSDQNRNEVKKGICSAEDEHVVTIVYNYFQTAAMVFAIDFPARFGANFSFKTTGRAGVCQTIEPRDHH